MNDNRLLNEQSKKKEKKIESFRYVLRYINNQRFIFFVEEKVQQKFGMDLLNTHSRTNGLSSLMKH